MSCERLSRLRAVVEKGELERESGASLDCVGRGATENVGSEGTGEIAWNEFAATRMGCG